MFNYLILNELELIHAYIYIYIFMDEFFLSIQCEGKTREERDDPSRTSYIFFFFFSKIHIKTFLVC